MVRSGRGCKLHGRESYKARVWSSSVVVSPPVFDDLPGRAVAGEQVFVAALITKTPDEALHQAVLHGVARRDVVPLHPRIQLPSQHHVGSELGAVVGNHQQRKPTPWRDVVHLSGHPLAGDGVVDDGGRALPCEVVDHTEEAEVPAVAQGLGCEVHRPALIGPLRDRESARVPSARLRPPRLRTVNFSSL